MDMIDIENILNRVQPSGFTDYRLFLNKVHKELKQAASLSWLDLAEMCELGRHNTLYQIVEFDRKLTLKTGEKVAKGLHLKGYERKYFLQLIRHQNAKTSAERTQAMEKMLYYKSHCLDGNWERQQLDVFSEWYHAAILELLKIETSRDDVHWLSQKLQPKVPPKKVQASLHLLQDLKLLEFDELRGRLYPTAARFSTGSEIRSMAVKSYHQKMIQLASQALSEVAATRRDISSVTVNIPADQLIQFKQLAAEFRHKVLELADQMPDSDELLQVNIQLFPLTQTENKKGEK